MLPVPTGAVGDRTWYVTSSGVLPAQSEMLPGRPRHASRVVQAVTWVGLWVLSLPLATPQVMPIG